MSNEKLREKLDKTIQEVIADTFGADSFDFVESLDDIDGHQVEKSLRFLTFDIPEFDTLKEYEENQLKIAHKIALDCDLHSLLNLPTNKMLDFQRHGRDSILTNDLLMLILDTAKVIKALDIMALMRSDLKKYFKAATYTNHAICSAYLGSEIYAKKLANELGLDYMLMVCAHVITLFIEDFDIPKTNLPNKELEPLINLANEIKEARSII